MLKTSIYLVLNLTSVVQTKKRWKIKIKNEIKVAKTNLNNIITIFERRSFQY